MLRKLSVPFTVVMAALILAPPVIAMPPDQCALVLGSVRLLQAAWPTA
jgi:hypothetical protein